MRAFIFVIDAIVIIFVFGIAYVVFRLGSVVGKEEADRIQKQLENERKEVKKNVF